MLDLFEEIGQGMLRNPLRTGLTALSVAWGMVMLVLLIAFGTGLANTADYQFRDDAVNSIWLYPGRTSRPYAGLGVGRRLQYTNADHDLIHQTVDGVEHITSRFYPGGTSTVAYRDKVGSFRVRSCHPGHRYIERTIMTKGRFLNDLDLAERRKVAVIGAEVETFLFEGGDAVGEEIDVGGITYLVVGVYEDIGSENEMRQVYIPITTAQAAYGGGDEVHQIMFTLGDLTFAESERVTDEVRRLLASRHHVHPEDKRAVRVRNNLERYEEIRTVLTWIRWFVWVVGVGTLTAGIVGVSNIMLVSVNERTKEIGLRKALGATPRNIVASVVAEAVVLTAVSGYGGLLVGVGIVELFAKVFGDNEYIRNPTIDLPAVLGAMALLVFFGALAGFFPAHRAATVNPVVALRDE